MLAGASFYGWQYYQNWKTIKTEEEARVLVEKIKTVSKLITVEGSFSEIYDYKDYWGYDLSPFRKKALVRVNAKVSVGYDLNQMKVEAFPTEKRIVISNLPDPEILSIDHDLDYYDLSEGTFNSFSTEDYNKINTNAKAEIEKKALESDLFLVAEEQSDNMLEMIGVMVESIGWELEYREREGLVD